MPNVYLTLPTPGCGQLPPSSAFGYHVLSRCACCPLGCNLNERRTNDGFSFHCLWLQHSYDVTSCRYSSLSALSLRRAVSFSSFTLWFCRIWNSFSSNSLSPYNLPYPLQTHPPHFNPPCPDLVSFLFLLRLTLWMPLFSSSS